MGNYSRATMPKCHRYSICQPLSLSLASHSAVHVHKCQHEQLPWQQLPPLPPTLTLFWSEPCSTSVTPPPSSFSFFPLFWAFFNIEKNICLALLHSELVANKSQYLCPRVSCVTCHLNYFPLLCSQIASGGLLERSGYCADPQIWPSRATLFC